MTLEEVMAFFKTGYNFKQKTGLSHSRFGEWRKKGFVPIISQMRIEKATNGVLVAKLGDVNGKLVK